MPLPFDPRETLETFFRSAFWHGVVNACIFIVKPESMTAYATIAAAIAAFLSLQAADHLEEATISTALAGKQIDLLATTYQNVRSLILIDDAHHKLERYLNAEAPLMKDQDESYQKELVTPYTDQYYEKFFAAFHNVTTSITALQTTYPSATDDFFTGFGGDLKELYLGISSRRVTEKQKTLPETNEWSKLTLGQQNIKIVNLTACLGVQTIALLRCSRPNLGKGRKVDGTMFSDCAKRFVDDTNRSQSDLKCEQKHLNQPSVGPPKAARSAVSQTLGKSCKPGL